MDAMFVFDVLFNDQIHSVITTVASKFFYKQVFKICTFFFTSSASTTTTEECSISVQFSVCKQTEIKVKLQLN